MPKGTSFPLSKMRQGQTAINNVLESNYRLLGIQVPNFGIQRCQRWAAEQYAPFLKAA